jgi:hypothetical protein
MNSNGMVLIELRRSFGIAPDSLDPGDSEPVSP